MNDTLSSSKEDLNSGLRYAAEMMRKGAVSAAEIAAFRRDCFAERSPSRAEVEALFGLDGSLRPRSQAWAAFLAEVVTDHVVWDSRPTGIVTPADAEWLLRLVDASHTAASFGVLLEVLDHAHQVPAGFTLAVRRRAASGRHDETDAADAFVPARAA